MKDCRLASDKYKSHTPIRTVTLRVVSLGPTCELMQKNKLMGSEINYNEVCYCVTVTGIPTFRIKITHNTLTDELNRPRLLFIRASHNTTSLALSWLFRLAPCFELRASCNM